MTRSGFFRAIAALFGLGAVRCVPQLAFAEDVCFMCRGTGEAVVQLADGYEVRVACRCRGPEHCPDCGGPAMVDVPARPGHRVFLNGEMRRVEPGQRPRVPCNCLYGAEWRETEPASWNPVVVNPARRRRPDSYGVAP